MFEVLVNKKLLRLLFENADCTFNLNVILFSRGRGFLLARHSFVKKLTGRGHVVKNILAESVKLMSTEKQRHSKYSSKCSDFD